ncbi:hypothetical protein ANO11243_051000 [Dothideomycetidae sp. 11243]|nr:hypothetical protein ANO11243_051000 [fungal sp. No.11243]
MPAVTSTSISSAAAAPTYTYNLFALDADKYAGSVINANPTATTLYLQCTTDTPAEECDIVDATVTVGQWAQITPPPSASTGIFDLTINLLGDNSTTTTTADSSGTWDNDSGDDDGDDEDDGPASYSVHCQMTSTTIPIVCGITTLGGTDNGTPMTTVTDNSSPLYSASPVPIIITAGADKLALLVPSSSAATTTSFSSSTSRASSSASKTGTATSSSSAGSATSTGGSSNSTLPSNSNGAAGAAGAIGLRTVGVVGLVAAVLMQI